MRVSWAVQGHPTRAVAAKALARKVGGTVSWDPDPRSQLRSAWRTFRHLLETTPAWATHRAQIQDDAEACDGLAAAVELAVAARPEDLLLLYVGGNPYVHAQAVREACWQGRCWAPLSHHEAGHWTPVVATVWPVALIPRLFEYVDDNIREGRWPKWFAADDEIVGRFVRAERIRVAATSPSLVQHRDMTPSLVGKRTSLGEDSGRVAALYAGDCGCDPREWDWHAGRHDFPENP